MDFFLGQIGAFGFNFAPKGWALCTGTILPIAQNSALFSLLGTVYGGNGSTTFALPNLQSRTPLGYDNNYPIGESAGIENVTLTNSEMPQHTHLAGVTTTNGNAVRIANQIFAQPVPVATPQSPANAYGPIGALTTLNVGSVSLAGGNQSHPNIQPSLAINFCIATTGIYPSRG